MPSSRLKDMRSAERSDRAQRPEELEHVEARLLALRKRVGVSKDALKVGITNSGRVVARTKGFEEHGLLAARTADDVLDSFDDPDRHDFWSHPVWKGAEPENLKQGFKETKRGVRKEQPEKREETDPTESSVYAKPRGE